MKTRITLIIIAILLIFLLFICPRKKKDELVFLMWGRAEEIKAVDNFIKEFNKIYPDIKVKRIHVSQYYEKLQTMFAGKTPPDVFYMGSEYFPTYVKKDALLDLTPYINHDPDTNTAAFNFKDYFPKIMDEFKYNGKYYGLSKDFTTMVLYYNKDIFQEEGISLPRPDWTWQDFRKAAVALTKKDKMGNQFMHYGFIFEQWVGYWISWIRQNGGEIFDEKKGQYIIGKEPYLSKNVEALQFLYDLMYKDGACPTAEESRDQGTTQIFEMGKAAMCTYGRWRTLDLKDKQFNWDVSILPKKRQRSSTLFNVCYSIARSCPKKLQAWQLVKFLVGKTGQIETAESGLAVPSLKKIAYSDHFFKPRVLKIDVDEKAFLEQIPYAKSMPAHEKAQELNDLINKYLDEIFFTKRPIREVLIELQNKIDEEINRKE